MSYWVSFAVVLAGFAAHAQPADTSSRFEVVSVRPSPPLPTGTVKRYFIGKRGGPGSSDPGRMEFRHYTVARLIHDAYGVESFQLSGPDWLNAEYFDITGKVPDGATKAQVPTMIQNLLTDRFQLKLHQEMREMSIYELSVMKGGPKLNPAATDVPRQEGYSGGMPSEGRNGFPELPPNVAGMVSVDGRARWQDPDTNVAKLAKDLARELGKPVNDATGLKGRFSISLYWVQDGANAGASAEATNAEAAAPDIGATDAALGPNIFRALKQQLGLRLDAKKGLASVLVVDSVAKFPIEN